MTQIVIRSRQLIDLGLIYDGEQFTGYGCFIPNIDIQFYDDEKWNKLISEITPLISKRKEEGYEQAVKSEKPVDTQSQVSGLIPMIRHIDIERSRYKTQLLEVEEELRKSRTYQLTNELRQIISDLDKQEEELRQQGKQIMIDSGLHDFTTLDGVKVQLNKTPGSLKIEEGFNCPDEYLRIKKEIDKTKLKKDYLDGKFYSDDISIDVEYKLVIK